MAAQSAGEVLEQPAVVVEARTLPQGFTFSVINTFSLEIFTRS